MKRFDTVKKKRFKIAIYTCAFLGCIAIYSIHKELESVATTSIAGILTIVTMFIGGDSFRKSDEN